MYYQPTQISYEHYHFLIMSAPDQKSMRTCIKVSCLSHVRLLTSASLMALVIGSEKEQRLNSGKVLWDELHPWRPDKGQYWCLGVDLPRWLAAWQGSHRQMAQDRWRLLWPCNARCSTSRSQSSPGRCCYLRWRIENRSSCCCWERRYFRVGEAKALCKNIIGNCLETRETYCSPLCGWPWPSSLPGSSCNCLQRVQAWQRYQAHSQQQEGCLEPYPGKLHSGDETRQGNSTQYWWYKGVRMQHFLTERTYPILSL